MSSGAFFHDWAEGGVEALKRDFDIKDDEIAEVEFIYASYTYESYNGEAVVIYKKDGAFFEVHGSHCSCYGLEGQWNPEEVPAEALIHRAKNGDFRTESEFKDIVLAALIEGSAQGDET